MANEMIRQPLAIAIGEAIVFDGATVQDEGSIVDVRGYGNLTLWIHETSGDGGITANVYMDHDATTAPAATTNMTPLRAAAGTITDFVVGASELGAFSLSVSCNFIGIKAKYTTAASDGDVYITGTADMG